MKKILITAALCLISVSSMAGNDTLPNGKPFQNLQEQINVINMTIAEQKIIYDEKFAELAAKDGQHDALIGAITVALNLVTLRVGQNEVDIEALQLADSLHDQLLAELNRRLTALEASTSETFSDLYEQDRLINQAIGALDSRLTRLEISSSATASQVSALQAELASYRARLAYLNTLLGSYCSSGEVVTGIYSTGQPRCADINQLGTVYTASTSLSGTSFCDTDTIAGCIDIDYYEYGTAFCAYGYVATGGGFSLGGIDESGGSHWNMISRPSGDRGWYVTSIDHGNRSYGGHAYVRCLQNQ